MPSQFPPSELPHPTVAPSDRPVDPAADVADQLLSLSRELLALVDRDGIVRRVSPAVERTLGWVPGALPGRPALALVHPDDRAAVQAVAALFAAGHVPDPAVVRHRVRCGDGGYRWLAWRASAPDHEGRVGVVAHAVDEARPVPEADGDASRDRETLLQVLQETQAIAHVGSWAWDPRANVVTWSDELYRIKGWEPNAVTASYDRFIALVHPDDRPRVEADIARAMRTGGEFAHDYRLVRGDGVTRTLHCRGRATLDRDGVVARVSGSCQDVTERVQVVEALRASEARYAHIAANAPGLVYRYVAHPNGRREFTAVSEGARHLLGVSPEALLRDPAALFDLVHPDDRASFFASGAAALAACVPWRWEGRAVLADGSERWVQAAAHNARQPDGTILADGVLMDVTEQRRAEALARRQHETLRAILDHIPAMVSFTDDAGACVFVNREWSRVTGWSLDEARSRDVLAELCPDAADRARILAFTRAGTGRPEEFPMRVRDGRTLLTQWTAVRLSDGSLVGLGLDVTERQRLEAQLRQAQKLEAVGRLAGGVAHDFNNLLTVIQSYGGFVAAELAPEGAAAADLAEVLRAASRAQELTRQLLAYGRQQLLQPRRLDVNATVTNVARILRRLIGEDLVLEATTDPGLWPVHADPGQLEQVLMNLALNARDAMPHGGTLRLRTSRVELGAAGARARPGCAPGQYVSLVVEDTGVGIDPAVLPHLFEPFVTTMGVGRGTGLGLATVHGIVEQSGGHVYVESVPEGGSRFTVLLPRLLDAPSQASVGASPTAIPRGSESILLVEDEDAVRSAFRRMLTRLGYTVRDARDGAEALQVEEATDAPIALLLTDVVMPGLSGRSLAEELVARRPGLRVLFMSGYTDDEILRRGLGQPGVEFLHKPCTMEQLASAVRRALDGR